MKNALERFRLLLGDKTIAVVGSPRRPAKGLAVKTHIRAGRKMLTNNTGDFVPFAPLASFLDAQVRRAGRLAALLRAR